MKTKRWTSAVCLLLSLLLLSACGSPEKKLQKEDAAIRAAMEQEGFGYGDKLAIYENALQQYSYHRYELPASLQAEKPEEIGAFVGLNPIDMDDKGNPTAIGLRFAFDQDLRFDFYVRDGNVDVSGFGDHDKYPLLKELRIGAGGDSWQMLTKWIERVRPMLLCLHELNARGGDLAAGGGDRLICYDRDAGKYTYRFVPEGMAPRSEDEIGAVFSYSITVVEAEGDYNGVGKVRGTSELMDWQLLDAVTGEILDSGQFGGKAPFVILGYNGNPNAGFTEQIGSMEITDMLAEIWRSMGRVWHE